MLGARWLLSACIFALVVAPQAGAVTRVGLYDFPVEGGGASHLVLVVRGEGPQRSDIAVARAPSGAGATVALTVTERAAPLDVETAAWRSTLRPLVAGPRLPRRFLSTRSP